MTSLPRFHRVRFQLQQADGSVIPLKFDPERFSDKLSEDDEVPQVGELLTLEAEGYAGRTVFHTDGITGQVVARDVDLSRTEATIVLTLRRIS